METKTDFPGVALVTGAASGIGLAVGSAFARSGCKRLILIDLNISGLESVASHLSATHGSDLKTKCLEVDISVEGAMATALETGLKEEGFGRLDYVVNCAGINGINSKRGMTNSTETAVDWFDRVNGVNYRGTWMANRAFLEIMMKQEPLPSHDPGTDGREQRGSIVNISSGLAVYGMPKNPVYSASKAALIALTRNDAIDYSEHKIRINCVCPGLIDTPMTWEMGGTSEDSDAMAKGVIGITPLKRLGKVNEIADCCLFLSSTRASWVQGQALLADGGIGLM